MRIDAYNQIAQLYGVSRTTKTAKTQSASRMSDQVSISQASIRSVEMISPASC